MTNAMPRATTLSDHAHRLVLFIRQSAAAAQGQGKPPAIALLTTDLTSVSSAVKAVAIGADPRTGLPCVLVQLADTREGPLKGNRRRPRHLTPPAACALLLGLLHVGQADAPASLTRDPLTAWLLTDGQAGAAGRDRCHCAALAVYDLNHATSGLEMAREVYRDALTMALDAAEEHFAALSRRHAGRPLRAA